MVYAIALLTGLIVFACLSLFCRDILIGWFAQWIFLAYRSQR